MQFSLCSLSLDGCRIRIPRKLTPLLALSKQRRQPLQLLTLPYSGSLSMQMPHRIIRAALGLFIGCFIKLLLHHIRYSRLSQYLKLMKSIAQRRSAWIKPKL